ncbi:uncharacterized protein N7458_007611 [Penicillium daleae]|uniref:Uncharacterized protein n=1 Tax=Penicillium daleae TaxID=63821 RepID=A0AAD6G0G2_9EURO|nr:uncharacterized protein N7458_007611 [Penicillium daleae]KAJ5443739.1 hypothetical protein N7458_007611 [Penicillium daleae]
MPSKAKRPRIAGSQATANPGTGDNPGPRTEDMTKKKKAPSEFITKHKGKGVGSQASFSLLAYTDMILSKANTKFQPPKVKLEVPPLDGTHSSYWSLSDHQATSTLNNCINLCASYNEINETKSTGKMFVLRFAGGMDSSMMIGQANVLGTQGTITRTAGV